MRKILICLGMAQKSAWMRTESEREQQELEREKQAGTQSWRPQQKVKFILSLENF